MTVDEISEHFRIPLELLEEAGVRHATDAEVREQLGIHGRLGQDLSGIIIPYRDPRDERVRGHRVRLDAPLPDGPKYLSEQGCQYLYFPLSVADMLDDLSVPVVLMEAEKSALALRALGNRSGRRILPVAIGGVWGFKRVNGSALQPNGSRARTTGPSPSFDWVMWQGRKVILALDSNVAGRRDLQKARLELAEELSKRGAQIFIASIPSRNGVNGPDDLIASAADDAALEMLDRAARFVQAKPMPIPGVLASDVTPEKVVWLWTNHIPLGKITLFDGDPDEGKSLVAIDLAARLTRGSTMPDGTGGDAR